MACRTWFRNTDGNGDETAAALKSTRDIARFVAGLSRAALNEIRGDIQSALVVDEDGRLRIYLGYHHEQVSLLAVARVLDLVNGTGPISSVDVERHFAHLWQACQQSHPDYQAQFVMQGARSRDIPFLPFVPNMRLWKYGWGCNGRVFLESASMADSWLGAHVAQNKPATKILFEALGIPFAPHRLVNTETELEAAAVSIGWPCAVKPSDRGRSIGVTTNVTGLPALVEAFRAARANSSAPIMVERFVPGDVYRIMVVRGRVAWIIRRSPPFVTGDGRRTLQKLVDDHNRRLAEARRPGSFRGETPLDRDLHDELERQNIRLDDIVPQGVEIRLRKVPLLATGAVHFDVTAKAHPDIHRMAEMLADALGFAICGIDYVCEDIEASFTTQGAVLEVNQTPGLRVPIVAGIPPEVVGQKILGDEAARIPVMLVPTEAARHEAIGRALPIHANDGWVIGGRCGVGTTPLAGNFAEGCTPENQLYVQTRQVLRNPLAERLFIVCDPQTVATHGLPVDRCDTAIAFVAEPEDVLIRILSTYSGTFTQIADMPQLEQALASWR
ncbi:hypothetical protein ACFODK_05990 [Altererythrobacter lauratis]|uniref:ATP-grasp domain-containing protein n=1 Tax=Alteraurantiacibacter lauratis TaxID=2054627 RepID=A0ABV7EF09_9SPHN